MNQYKMDWYLATQVISEVIHSKMEKETPSHDMIDQALLHTQRSVMTWAIPRIMKHLSQNQIKGTLGIMGRVGGRVGLRAVPVLGTIMMVKDAYSLYDYLTDA